MIGLVTGGFWKYAQDGGVYKRTAKRANELFSFLAVRSRVLCQLEKHAQNGRGVKRPALRANELLSFLAVRSRVLCQLEKHAQNGRGVKRPALRANELLSFLAVRSRVLCQLEKHAQNGRGVKRPALRANELLSFLAVRSRVLCALVALCAASGQSKYVVMISIDGGAAFHLENQALEIPNIRSLIRKGVWAESSETVFPTVTHPSHITLITGVHPAKHGVLANEMADKEGNLSDENTFAHRDIVLTDTIFDQAKRRGLVTASLYWPESVDDPSIDYNLITRSKGGQRSLVRNAWTEELQRAGIPVELYDAVHNDMDSDALTDDLAGRAAAEVIRQHRPNLLAIHFLQTDHAQHRFGPAHPITQAAFHLVDSSIGRIIRATNEAGIADETTFIICADHGFSGAEYQLNIAAYLGEAGLEGKVRLYPTGSGMFVRELPNFVPAQDAPKLEQMFTRLRNDPHILHIYQSGEFPKLGLPRFEDSSRVQGQFLILSDIDTYLAASPNGSTSLKHLEHPAFGHGTLPQFGRMYPMLVLSGSGVKSGIRIGHVHNVDVAPTVCRLLGLPKMEVEGRVLGEALLGFGGK
jgi:hypothetical protein